ncbi:hypothetical protein MXEN_07406 [Mycobacterium xenopi RIVM700367]|nr:hypothetical protein MXEN_07406 [Mycobacterium xenopi RIVM700367]
MDIVLGVSMAPTTVRLVLIEGENADGATVDEDGFEVVAAEDSPTSGAPERVIAAILGTRESAAEGDYRLASTGVTWTDPVEAAILRDALAAHKVENVMLVSAFLAAAALAQSVGSAVGYAHTGLLFLEPDTATLAVVDSADGSIIDVRRRPVQSADAVDELTDLVAQFDALESPPDGVFLVGAGVDITSIKPCVESATTLPVTVPEEPETALARGAALASAHAPLFVSSTAAVAYSQVPDWTTAGVVDASAAGAGSRDAGADAVDDPAYSYDEESFRADEPGRRPFLVALGVMTVFFVGVSALVISLGLRARPAVSQQPRVGTDLIFPVKEAPVPAPKAPKPEPQAPLAPPPNMVPPPAPEAQQAAPKAVAPAAPPPAPMPEAPAPEAAVPAPVPAVSKPVPVPVAATPPPAAPAPVPAAQAPVPAAPPPAAPPPAPVAVAPLPIPVPAAPAVPILPPIFNPPAQNPPVRPGGGDHDRGGWPGGSGNDRGGWPPGRGWQPGGDRGGSGWLPGGIAGNHGGLGGIGGGGHGGFGGIGGIGGGFGGFGGRHGGR